MQISLDGTAFEVAEGTTIQGLLEATEAAGLLKRLGLGLASVLVAVNGTVVHPRRFKKHKLNPGDEVDLVLPSFGG